MVWVLADDLTGACDTVLPFFKRIGQAWVVSGAKSSTPDTAQVRSIHLGCRTADRATIIEQVAAVLAPKPGDVPLYLKMDSTLRGNWPAFVKAIYNDTQTPVLACPAYPAAGRLTQNGIHRVHGVPVHHTIAGKDPEAPVTTSHLPSLIKQTDLSTAHLDVALLDKPVTEVVSAVQWVISNGAQVISADATTDAHLATLAAVVNALSLIPCGSAGLAHAIAPHWLPNTNPLPALPTLPADTPMLVVSGSQTPLTRQQVSKLPNDTPRITSTGDFSSTKAWRTYSSEKIQEAMVGFSKQSQSLWILCGGDTAALTLSTLGITESTVVGEVAPNMALLKATLPAFSGHTAWIVAKSGNFGTPTTLVEIMERLLPHSTPIATAC